MNYWNRFQAIGEVALRACLLGVAAVWLTGCSSPQTANPNPPTRFVFPGEQPSTASVAASPAPPSAPTPDPAPAPTPPVVPGTNLPPGSASIANSSGVGFVRVGDSVIISFSDTPPAVVIPPVQVRIGEDGDVTLHLNQTVSAAGKTVRQLEQEIRSLYVPKYYNYMTVTVKTEERFYFVGGEVRNGNRMAYFGPITVLRAIDTAGGFTEFANRRKIELTRQDGKKIRIDYNKAIKNAKLDPEVFVNDQILVPRRFW